MNNKWLHIVAYLLLFVGGLNWGLVGLLNVNVVMWLLGSWPMVEKAVYVLVGVAAVWVMFTHMSDCKVCSKK
ncbi:MAG TPA: DUF378 domain-containing protein [Candidatus Eisenbacteria bacterium]|nr:DUF378 domain-containing protein [Candidatus Eisenbacteria bacterium]